MVDEFFRYWDELPENGGFSLYDKTHIIWLVVIAAAVCAGSYVCRRADARKQERILKACATTTLCLEALKDIYLLCTGHMNVSYLPLEMCGLAIFIELLYVFTRKTAFGEIMCVICMPGACAALLFPDWTDYPFFNFMHINSFLLHGLLVAVPVMSLASGWYKPSVRRLYQVLVFLCIIVPLIYVIDANYGCNFMFLLHPSTGSPFRSVYQRFGTVGYLFTYAGTVIVCILLIYGVFCLAVPTQNHFHLTRKCGIPKETHEK